MKLFVTLQKTEIKRALRVLPQYFFGVTVLTLLIGVVALFGFLSTRNEQHQELTVALVMGNNEFLSTMGMQILDGTKSAEGLCSFTTCDSEELALSRLASGEYTAVIVFPDSFVSAALYHDEAQANIYMPFMQNSFYGELLTGLGDAAGALLENSEACITTVSVYRKSQELESEDSYRLDTEINTMLSGYALDREDLFVNDTASGTGNVTAIQYYTNAVIVMLLLLGGISCGPLLKGDSKAYQNQLTHHGIGPFRQLYAKCLAVLSLFLSFYLAIFLGIVLFKALKPETFTNLLKLKTYGEIGYWFFCGLPILLLAMAIVVLIYTFSANQIGGILLLFLITVLMGYASGCIAPAAFLPLTVRNMATNFPTTKMFETILSGLRQELDFSAMWWVFGEAFVCILLALGITYGKKVYES